MVCKKIADLTSEQAEKRREWRREWARKFRETDEHKEKWNEYYIRNKDKFREYFFKKREMHTKRFQCACGGRFTFLSINSHVKTKNHQNHLKDYPDYVIDREQVKRKSLEHYYAQELQNQNEA